MKEIVDKFRENHGEGDVKKYYDSFDAVAELLITI